MAFLGLRKQGSEPKEDSEMWTNLEESKSDGTLDTREEHQLLLALRGFVFFNKGNENHLVVYFILKLVFKPLVSKGFMSPTLYPAIRIILKNENTGSGVDYYKFRD